MANWLQKLMPPATTGQIPGKALVKTKPGMLTTQIITGQQGLPNASAIYGIAASILIVIAVYFLFKGLWFTAFLVLVPAACFIGFALHFLGRK